MVALLLLRLMDVSVAADVTCTGNCDRCGC